MIKKIFIIFTVALLILFNATMVRAATSYNEYIEEYDCSIKIRQVKEFGPDEINEGYYSVIYEVVAENCTLLSYRVPTNRELPWSGIICSCEETKEKRDFNAGENFRILLPEEDTETEFLAFIQVISTFEVEAEYELEDGSIETQTIREFNDQVTYFDNRFSTVRIKITDKETQEGIEGITVYFINYNIYSTEFHTTDAEGKIIAPSAAGNVMLDLFEVPDDYIVEQNNYELTVGYKEDVEFNEIQLKHRKGILKLYGNSDFSFELYDGKGNLVKNYTFDEQEEIVDVINTGSYTIKQIKLSDDYEISLKFNIVENKESEISIITLENPEETGDSKETGDNGETSNTNENRETNQGIEEDKATEKEVKTNEEETKKNEEEIKSDSEITPNSNKENGEGRQSDNTDTLMQDSINDKTGEQKEDSQGYTKQEISEPQPAMTDISTNINMPKEEAGKVIQLDKTQSLVSLKEEIIESKETSNKEEQLIDFLQENNNNTVKVERMFMITENANQEDASFSGGIDDLYFEGIATRENIDTTDKVEEGDIIESNEEKDTEEESIREEIETSANSNSNQSAENQVSSEITPETISTKISINPTVFILATAFILITIFIYKKKKQTAKQSALRKKL